MELIVSNKSNAIEKEDMILRGRGMKFPVIERRYSNNAYTDKCSVDGRDVEAHQILTLDMSDGENHMSLS